MFTTTTSLPSPVLVHTSPCVIQDNCSIDALGYSFFPSSTRQSRHDHRLSAAELPSYSEFEAMPPPQYSVKDEPVTLAMYLFKFGFLFPPFWIMGVFILFSPLRAPPVSAAAGEWLPEKTDAEKQMVIDGMRRAETKWARRCLVALLALVLASLVVGLATWAVLRH
ncbi:hypothetical protein BDZ89DRAFT_1057382 [Hymenopellis radicata]|nr:hypothetical protein BDZ89DRAFT_1057382 [Hymenopellis radicata]